MNNQTTEPAKSISPLIISLLRGVISREDNERLWHDLLQSEALLRDYLTTMGLDLVISLDEGFAYLRNRKTGEGEDELPKLIQRRQLSYPVSLILALLRRKLAEHDASSAEARLILDTEDTLNMLSTFLPSGNNEARVMDNLENHLRKIADLGFIRFLAQDTTKFEVKRILKAFIDAQWLQEFDQRLAEYLNYAISGNNDDGDAEQ